nr:YsnF/AvaK domain-containing protein [uncultured Rhodopila sp.]
MSLTSGNETRTAFPIFDMMLQMQRIGFQAMSVYKPVASAFLDAAKGAERAPATSLFGTAAGRIAGDTKAEQVVAIGEEVLNVGTRTVPGKTTRVRRVVVETPVQQEVTLHTETVVVERRKPNAGIGQDVLTEVTVEMSDSNEVPVVSKSVHLVEEVLLRKEVTARTETIRDTVKRDTLEIEEPSQLPVVFNAAKHQDDRRRDEKRVSEAQDKKQPVVPMTGEVKAAEQKRTQQ